MATKRAAFQLRDNNTSWFLSGHRYVRMKINQDQVEDGPGDLPGAWVTFNTVGWIEADAFLSERTQNGQPERAFVFNGDQVMSIQVDAVNPWHDRLWPAGSDSDIIANKWKALEIAGFAGGVDAAFRILPPPASATTDEAWFFRGYHCVRIRYIKNGNELTNTFVREGPVIIATIFPGLGDAGFDSVNCVLNSATENERWFFKGTKAVLINTINGEKVTPRHGVDPGPHDVHTKFPSLHREGFYP